MQNRQESLDVASPDQLWFPSLDSASSDSCIVFRKSAYRATHDSVHRCLALRTPVLTAVLFRQIRQVERRFFFFFASITLTLFEKPKQQNQEKCRGGYFRRDNRDQASSRIAYRSNLNFDSRRMVLRQKCFGMQSLPQWVQKTNWQGVRETQESIDSRAREKKPVDMVTFPATLDAEPPRDWPKTVADRGFESRGGGGGGAWNSKTPKLVIATRSRRGPALAPSRGSRGMLPGKFWKLGCADMHFLLFWGIISEKSESEFAR